MTLSLRPRHLRRYKDIARLLLKYGRSSFIGRAGLESVLEEDDRETESATPQAEALAADLEALGPTFVKLGQVLSGRADLLPPAYLRALSRLQDQVEPFSFDQVEEIVTGELGVRLSKAFSRFDPVPIAAASLGQVHRAAMRDGREVAVKVQRPGIRETIAEDLEALDQIAIFLDEHSETARRYGFPGMIAEFRKSLIRELDYREEARNLTALATNLAEIERIVVPLPIEDYTTSRVLTMDFIRGRKITSLGPLARLEMDGGLLAEQLMRAYLQQVLVDGFFHADPHPGNIFLTDDGQLALIDLGMVARVTPGLQEQLLKLLLAVSEGRGEEAASHALGLAQQKIDEEQEASFRRRVGDIVVRQQGSPLAEIEVGRVVLELAGLMAQAGAGVPPELTLLGKTLLQLDEVGRTLDPGFDPNAAVRRQAADITRRRMQQGVSIGNLFSTVLEMREFAARLPGRVNPILDAVATNQLEFKVRSFDETRLMEGLQKIANRITVGLVLAALIVGASLLMQVQTSFRIFGYPGLAMLCFLAAAGGGFALVLNIVFNDEHARGRRGRR